MMGKEQTLQEITLADGRIQLSSTKPCNSISTNFGVIEFNIQSAKVKLAPAGYLYMNNNKCYVGIEAVPDKFN